MTAGLSPMLATASTGQGNRRARTVEDLDGYAFEEKIDGVRAIVTYDAGSGTITILNRSGNDITLAFPEVTDAIAGVTPTVVLDGEIVLRNGTFGDLNGRAKVTVAGKASAKAEAMPAKFVAFDVLHYGGQDLIHLPYTERRRMLLAIGEAFNDPAFEVVRASFDGRAFFEQVKAEGGEGVIAKKITSTYVYGKRAPEWVKFKCLQSITCIAVSYEPGKGARAHIGAIHLAVVGGAKPVYVGRVGTGLTAAELLDVKSRLDAGQYPVVEIETLGRTKDNKLRFPVWKGLRSDLGVMDASQDQLAALVLQ